MIGPDTLPTTLYKLTTADGYTRKGQHNACLWGPGITHTARGPITGNLCGPAFVHAYTHPLLAILLNPIHARIKAPRLWEASGIVAASDRGLMVGCRALTTIRELPVPSVTIEMRVSFGIRCALEVTQCAAWRAWAVAWLSGEDNSGHPARKAAWKAERAAAAAAAWATKATWAAATEAAWAAAGAAETAAHTGAIDFIAHAEAACAAIWPPHQAPVDDLSNHTRALVGGVA